MNHLDDNLIRDTLQDAARSVSVPADLEERLIASARTNVDLARVRPAAAPEAARRGRRWLPLLAAAVVIAIAIAATVVARHGRHAQPTRPGPTPTQSTLAPVPAGFTSVDVSFANPQHGWALGTVLCPNGKDKTCPSVIRTSDGGRTWGGVGAPSGAEATLGDCYGSLLPQTCVARVTFANDQVGYLWSSTAMYLTRDGGATWTRQTGNARYLVAAHGVAVRLGDTVIGHVRSIVLESAPVGTDAWHQIAFPGGGIIDNSSVLAAGGEAIYLLKAALGTVSPNGTIKGGEIALYRSTNGAQTWQKMTEKLPTNFLFSLAAGKDDSIALPVLDSVGSTAGVHISSDGGRTFGAYRPLPTLKSPPVLLVVSADRLLAVGALTEAKSGASVLKLGTLMYLTTNAGRNWHLVLRDTPAGPYLGTGFTSVSNGYRLAGDLRSIWTTSDGGETWVRHSFR